MAKVELILAAMRANQKGIRFTDVFKVCVHYFGQPRIRGSHCIFRTPWKGNPRINIQNRNGFVIEYQVKQVLAAIARLEENDVTR